VIFIEKLKEQAIIRQQIVLNSRMFAMGKIPRHLHDQTNDILLGRLTKVTTHDKIVEN